MPSSTDPHQHGVTIHINKSRFVVDVPITGAELRRLGEIPDASQLFLEAPGPTPDTLIVPTESYDLKDGSHLYDLPRGTVGNAALADQVKFALDHLPEAESVVMPDGRVVLRWHAEAPESWQPNALQLALEVPPLYPAQAPSGFDVVGPIVLSGAPPAGSGARNLDGAAMTHFCWNPASAITYTTEDGLWRFARFSETRFRELN
ncbi:MAG TPA: hypothetical protein VGM94_01595 [Galbitalea sp.]